MRRKPRRPTYYEVRSEKDGTILGAYPVRKPSPHVIKRDHLKIDPDNICREYSGSFEKALTDVNDDRRFRPQDLIANCLNMRRVIRALVLPELAAIQETLAAMQAKLEALELRHDESHVGSAPASSKATRRDCQRSSK